MVKPEQRPSNVYLAPAHLNHIRATIDWQAMFEGLALRKAKRKSKQDDWWAFSPFKEERSPSFHMGPGGIWYDFSVGMGGGPIELIQRIHSLNCYEAANFILEQGWAHSALTVRGTLAMTQKRVETVSKDQPQNMPVRQNLLPMCAYHDYLAERGISEETCQSLGIGYLPQGRSPLRGRVIFQIRDARVNEKTGEREQVILSHMGRAIDDETKPKYLFYEGFHKSVELYGQDVIWTDPVAQQQIQDTGHIILTEGPIDVAKAHEAGLRNVVASFGANLSNTQASSLVSMCEAYAARTILIIYDRDETGQQGAENAQQKLADLRKEINIFDWKMSRPKHRDRALFPESIHDFGDFSSAQIVWLRQRSLI